MGKKVDDGGIKVWTHIKWANDALQLVMQAGLAASSSYIQPIRQHLPDILKTEIGFTHTDWTAFTHTDWTAFMKAICGINMEAIFDYIDHMAIKAKDETCLHTMIQTVADNRSSRLRTLPFTTLPVQPIPIQPSVAPGLPILQRTPGEYANAPFRGGRINTSTPFNEERQPLDRQPLSEAK